MIVPFYENRTPDDKGRYLADLQRWPDDRLESHHDFIQWMFPLREMSGANPTAPTLDDSAIQEFRSRSELRNNLRVSFVRMLRFYGFEMGSRIVPALNFKERARNWLLPYNHNHLRITRIIKSLTTLGLEEEAQAFFLALSEIYEAQDANQTISRNTFGYWQSAAQQTHRARE